MSVFNFVFLAIPSNSFAVAICGSACMPDILNGGFFLSSKLTRNILLVRQDKHLRVNKLVVCGAQILLLVWLVLLQVLFVYPQEQLSGAIRQQIHVMKYLVLTVLILLKNACSADCGGGGGGGGGGTPNLTAGVSSPSTATVGVAQTFTATITNNGTASTGASFSNFFQRATLVNGGEQSLTLPLPQ